MTGIPVIRSFFIFEMFLLLVLLAGGITIYFSQPVLSLDELPRCAVSTLFEYYFALNLVFLLKGYFIHLLYFIQTLL